MTEKFKILIGEDLEPNHYVESNYPGQYPEQMPIYIYIDLEDTPTVYVDTYNFQQNGTPADIWNNRRLAFELPQNVDASRLYDWVDTEFRETIENIIDSITIEWNGNNYVGTTESEGGVGELVFGIEEYEIQNSVPTYDHGGLYRPDEWFQDIVTYPDEDNPVAVFDLGGEKWTIKRNTSDDDIMKIAQELEEYSELDNVVFIGTIEGFLTDLRDECEVWHD